jgi:hypothetical protein
MIEKFLFPVFGSEMATAKIQTLKGRGTGIDFRNWAWYNFLHCY